MTKDEALKLALKHAERDERHLSNAETRYWCDQYKLLATQAIEALAQPEQEPKCNPHPKAPHGFNRNASHSNDRYTCECEGWDAYEAGYQDGLQKGFETEPEQEPVAWRHKQFLETQEGWFYADWHPDGINPPSAELLYTNPPQRKPLTDEEIKVIWRDIDGSEGMLMRFARAIEAAHGIKENT